jgi:hypothetical protein
MNDTDCLTKMHAAARAFADTPQAIAMARDFETLDDAIAYIRALDQRNDLGNPHDGPRIQCDVSQRLRLPASDPQCFERTGMFLALASLLEPDLEVTSATIRVDNGLHTFPAMHHNGRWRAVILDPTTGHLRNAMTATAYKLRNASPMSSRTIGPWFADIAHSACIAHGAPELYHSTIADIRNGLTTGQPLERIADIEDMLELTEPEAELFGAGGRVAHQRMHRSLRNLSIKLDSKRVSKFLNQLIDTAEPLAGDLIKAALIAEFGPAAQIALQGVDLATKKQRTPTAQDSGKPTSKPENQASPDKPDRAELRRRMRRMTLAFRNPPQNKET